MPSDHTHHADRASPATAAVNRCVAFPSAVPCHHSVQPDDWRTHDDPIHGRMYNSCYYLRSSDALLLVVPRIHTKLARRTFSVAAPSTWNSLPADIRLCKSLLTFKCHLKTDLFKLTWSSCAATSTSVSSDLKTLHARVLSFPGAESQQRELSSFP